MPSTEKTRLELLEELHAIAETRDGARRAILESEKLIATANIDIRAIERDISMLKELGKAVTDHAIVRFLERVDDEPIEDLKIQLQEFLEFVNYEEGNYRFFVDDNDEIILDDDGEFTAVVRGKYLTTILAPGMKA